MAIVTGHTFASGELVTASKLNTAVNDADVNATDVTATGSTAARTLAVRFSDVINVKDFGATGNGSADDTAAIQAAITSVIARSGQLYFPTGTYLITAPLYVTPPTDEAAIRIFGEAKARSVTAGTIIKRATNGDMFRLNCDAGTTNKTVVNGLQYFQMENLTLYSTSTEGSGSHAIFSRTARWAQIRNLRIKGFDRAIEIYSVGDYSDFNTIEDIQLDVYRSGVRNRSADDCIIKNIYQLSSSSHNPSDQNDAIVTIAGGFRSYVSVISGDSYSGLSGGTINPVISIQETEGATVSGHCEESDHKPFVRGLHNKSLKFEDMHIASNATSLGTKIVLYACVDTRMENVHCASGATAATTLITCLDSVAGGYAATTLGLETGCILDDNGTLKDIHVFNENTTNFIVHKPSFNGLAEGNYLRPLLQTQSTDSEANIAFTISSNIWKRYRHIRSGDTVTKATESNETFKFTPTASTWKDIGSVSVVNSSKSMTWELQVHWFDYTNMEAGTELVTANIARNAGYATAKAIATSSLGGNTATLTGFGAQFGSVTGGVADTQTFNIQIRHTTAGATVFFMVTDVRKIGYSTVTTALVAD
jgi:hypothetical protein